MLVCWLRGTTKLSTRMYRLSIIDYRVGAFVTGRLSTLHCERSPQTYLDFPSFIPVSVFAASCFIISLPFSQTLLFSSLLFVHLSSLRPFYWTFSLESNSGTNERSLFANERSEQWLVTSTGRSPSKLATKETIELSIRQNLSQGPCTLLPAWDFLYT